MVYSREQSPSPAIRISAPDDDESPLKQKTTKQALPFKGLEKGVKPTEALQHILDKYPDHHDYKYLDIKQALSDAGIPPPPNIEMRFLRLLLNDHIESDIDVGDSDSFKKFIDAELEDSNSFAISSHLLWRVANWDTNDLREKYEELTTREGLAWLLYDEVRKSHFERKRLYTPEEALKKLLEQQRAYLEVDEDGRADRSLASNPDKEIEALWQLRVAPAHNYYEWEHLSHWKWRCFQWDEQNKDDLSEETKRRIEEVYKRDELALKILEVDQANLDAME